MGVSPMGFRGIGILPMIHGLEAHATFTGRMPVPLSHELLQVLDAALGLLDGAALDAQDDVALGPAADLDHLLPVDHAVAAGAADRRAGDLAALGLGVLDRDVLGVQVDQPGSTRSSQAIGSWPPR